MQKSPGEWLRELEKRLEEQARAAQLFCDYYDGKHRLKFATDKFREVFGGLFGTFADNWCRIIVDASVERLHITGFRFGDDQQADEDAWHIWQRNNLDAESVIAHTEAGKSGAAYVIVQPNGDKPRITTEHVTQVVVAHSAGDRRQRDAALKKWLGDDGFAYATLYLPNRIHKFRSQQKVREFAQGSRINWQSRPGDEGGRHDLGVPVVPIYNSPGMLAGGSSDLLVAVPMQDAINKQVLDMMVASEFQAFRQRVLIGVELPKDAAGNVLPAAELKAMASRIWNFENENAKVEELAGANLDNYVKPIEMLIQHLAAQTRTPPHYLLSSIVNASGDALKAAEAGLVSKVQKKMLDFSEPWEEVQRLAFRSMGDEKRGGDVEAVTLWGDPEMKSEGELVDAAVKLRTLGLPFEMVWERVGLSAKDIERAKQLANLPKRPPPGATLRDAVMPNGDGETRRDSGATAGTTPNGGTS